jgi:hypothetical protein
MVDAVKVIFSLKNVRRAPGDAGSLKRITEIERETKVDSFIQRNGTLIQWPGSMYITVCLDVFI